MKYSLILLCAGKGTRSGLEYNKIFYQLTDKTVYEKNIENFINDNRCKQIIVVTKADELKQIKQLVHNSKIEYVFGGKERQDSVLAGLEKVKEEYVLIHDGARPYVSKQNIDDLIMALSKYDAALLMVACKDTIKKVQNGFVQTTLKREELMQAQTPQAFKSKLIKGAYLKAKKDNFQATDDSQLFEKYENKPIKVVIGDYQNLKITTKEDL